MPVFCFIFSPDTIMEAKTGQRLMGCLAAMALISIITMGVVVLYGQYIRDWFATQPAPTMQPGSDFRSGSDSKTGQSGDHD